MKDSGLRIRVERELREQFLRACRAQDTPSARVLREFMREFVADHNAVAGSEEKKDIESFDDAQVK